MLRVANRTDDLKHEKTFSTTPQNPEQAERTSQKPAQSKANGTNLLHVMPHQLMMIFRVAQQVLVETNKPEKIKKPHPNTTTTVAKHNAGATRRGGGKSYRELVVAVATREDPIAARGSDLATPPVVLAPARITKQETNETPR